MRSELLTIRDASARLSPLGYRLTDLMRREEIGYVGRGSARRIPVAEIERIEAGHRVVD